MKKLIIISLAVLMALSISITAFAASGAFISSPEGNKAPRLMSYRVASAACKATFKTTAYTNRGTLGADNKQNIEEAYNAISKATDLTALNADLADLAKKGNIAGKNIAISDLFDISVDNYDAGHDSHGKISFTLEADTLSNFVGLMCYNDGKWTLIEDAKVSGKTVSFSTDDVAAFAIVVSKETTSPETGNSNVYAFAAIMMASAASIVVCCKKYATLNK